MKDFYIYIPINLYLKEWLEHKYGNPVKFPSHSQENYLLSRVLSKAPNDYYPIRPSRPHITIILPDNCIKRPEYYHYLGRRGRKLLIEDITILFKIHLWSSISFFIHSDYSLNEAIDKWCENEGISLDNREAVRQLFYRMRCNLEKYGIILGKKYAKKVHNLGKK